MNHFNFSIIICTADRPRDVERFLHSLERQTLIPMQLIVVDASSEPAATRSLVQAFSKSTRICSQHIQSSRGLTIQRNIGIANVFKEIDIISFFDDDIELKSDYLEKIAAVFESDENTRIGGVGGKIILPIIGGDTRGKGSNGLASLLLGALQRLFILSSSRSYAILMSGINVSNEHKVFADITAAWLHGCTSYRRLVFDHLLFDESLTDYSMREDVDFSFRVSKRFELVYTPGAEMIHHHSETRRASAEKFGEMDIESWHWFVWKNMPRLRNRIYFCWSALGYIVVLLVSALVNRNRSQYLRAIGGIHAFLHILNPQVKKPHATL